MAAEREVTLYFDPLCPWAFMTAQWLREVHTVRPVSVRFRLMSLAVLNEAEELTDEMRGFLQRAWGPVRVMAAAAAHGGDEVLDRLYNAFSSRVFRDNRREDLDEVMREALAEVGLSEDLAAAATTDQWDAAVREAHEQAMSAAGMRTGTPIIVVDGVAYFGPVIAPAPHGEKAGQLFDAIAQLAGFDGFFELKRHRDRQPSF